MNGSLPASPRTPARHSPPPLRGAASFYSDGADPPSSNKAGCPRPRRAGGGSGSLSPGHRPVAPSQVRGSREPPRDGAGLGWVGRRGEGIRGARRWQSRARCCSCLPGIGSQGSGMADRALQPVGCAGAALPVRPSARPPAGAARRCSVLLWRSY